MARQHRHVIVTSLADPSREIPFTTRALGFDAKNYHTWAYRQRALSHFYQDQLHHPEIWNQELSFTESMLNNDVRNNSAWNHRWFTVFERFQKPSERTIDEEIKQVLLVTNDVTAQANLQTLCMYRFTKAKIELAPNNPSAWNYLRG